MPPRAARARRGREGRLVGAPRGARRGRERRRGLAPAPGRRERADARLGRGGRAARAVADRRTARAGRGRAGCHARARWLVGERVGLRLRALVHVLRVVAHGAAVSAHGAPARAANLARALVAKLLLAAHLVAQRREPLLHLLRLRLQRGRLVAAVVARLPGQRLGRAKGRAGHGDRRWTVLTDCGIDRRPGDPKALTGEPVWRGHALQIRGAQGRAANCASSVGASHAHHGRPASPELGEHSRISCHGARTHARD